ncbi:MAG: dimethyladenosine transferase [uncultured bacterium]|nr:MAG: dimethyladenosine transferase [uncultured bacterium]
MKFGQHFLIDPTVLQTMVQLTKQFGSPEVIVEIGPGKGVLTERLVHIAKRVIAIEIDKTFASILTRLQATAPQLEIIYADALSVDLTALGLVSGHYSVSANLPYEITSNILRRFLTQTPYPKHLALLIQKEVAERIVASPGQLSILGLSVQAFARPHLVQVVPPRAFQPPPKVDSAIVSLDKIRQNCSLVSSQAEKRFFQLAKAGFVQKRKLLMKNLKNINKNGEQSIPTAVIEAAFRERNINPLARAQELALEDWLYLVDKFGKFIV